MTPCTCDLEKSFIEKTVEMTSHMCLLIYAQNIVDNTYDVSRGMGVRKVSGSKSDLQSRSRTLAVMPFDRPQVISF